MKSVRCVKGTMSQMCQLANINRHFLISTSSDQTNNNDVTVTPARCLTSNHRSQHHVTRPFHRSENEILLDPEQILPLSARRRADHNPLLNAKYTVAMKPSGYTEAVSVTRGPPSLDQSVLTICDFKVNTHYRESVNVGPGLSPVWYQSRIVCHSTTSKKNFRTSVDYVPKIKPFRYESTQFVRPKHLVTTYVSYVDYTSHDDDKLYTTSVHFTAVSGHFNSVHNFQMLPHPDDITAPDDNQLGADINMNIVKDPVVNKNFRQPTLLMSSGPDDAGDATTSGRMSHRSKMIVESTPAQHVTREDYAAYLNGYLSDVNANGYALNGTERSDDVSEA
ncbi:hypothetical protein LSH36_736g01010 [Paralvinella palmiformis]|uniref:Uncharacterized protein n=1 Tax=Paralvinella palmiformis TaxID=53620 RepID=A0AAD9MUW0_9ANNE|nr:hypothetical protein LSH36_736g01010 [Paralvinella palmiformis]